MLALGVDAVGREFRGAAQTGAYRYLARAGGAPFGYVDCGTFVAPGSDRPTGSIAFAVDPQVRGRGLGRAMLSALVRAPELASVAVFEAGVDPKNVASRRCLEAAGFALASEEPDAEGLLCYRLRRR
jgi:L-amino acid N-acyltransferase YncA